MREEIFGPVAASSRSTTRRRRSQLANDTIYGLSGSIWTRDGAKALRVARAMDTGVLSINSNTSVRVSTPFGGFKQSGYGRELGPHALDAYTRGEDRLLRDGGLMAGRLDGKVCVITGAASGIGAETARRFREEGAKVVGVDLRDDVAGVDLALACDVADEDAVRGDVRARCATEFGRIDVLFNNAGISPTEDASVLDTTLDAWQRVQDVNVKSVFFCCKHGIPHLLDGGGGSVINTASFVAVMGAATSQISYTASKGAVLALSRELGVEFARRGRARQRALPRPGQHAAAAGAVRQGPGEGARGGSCTSRWAASPRRARSPTPRSSSPPTSPPTSPPRRSSSTAASPAPT